MKTMMRVSLLAIAAFLIAACQPAANTNTNSNTNANSAPKAAAPTADSLMALDTKAWDAWKAKDGAHFNSFLDDKFVSFDNGKREGKAEAVKGISENKCEIKSHTLSDPKVTMAGADAAVLTYKATVDGTCPDDKGASQKIPSPLTVATVYVRSGDTWKGAFHADTPVIEMKPAEGGNSNKAPDVKKEAAGAENKSMPTPPPPKDEAKPASNAAANSTSSNSNSNSASSTSDALTDAIMAVEKKGWEAWMKQDSKAMEETIAKDISFVDPTGKGYFGKADVLKEWMSGQCKVTSVDVSDGKASMINADVAILTYKGSPVGTCGDMKLEPIWGTTVAVKEGDSWKAAYIFEMPVRK